MKVKVNIISGGDNFKHIDLDLEAKSTILDVKKKIEDSEGVSVDTQKLFRAYAEEKELWNDICLAESEDCVDNEDIITLVLYLKERGNEVKCLIEFKPWNQELDQELFIQLINDLPVVEKVTVDLENSLGDSLQLIVSKKESKFETEAWIGMIQKGLRRKVYELSDVENEDSLNNLMTFLKKEDNVTFSIEYQNKENAKIVFFDTLIPCSSRKLQQLEDEKRKLIIAEFRETLEEPTTDASIKSNIVNYIVNKLDKFETGDMEELGRAMKENYLSPYIPLVNWYSKKGGTIGGLLLGLNQFPEKYSIPERKLNELRVFLKRVRDEEFVNWENMNKPDYNIPHLHSYHDFQQKLECGYEPRDIIEKCGKNWNELQIEEGDQVWMWRSMTFGCFQYAHVGIFLNHNEGSMVHVTPKHDNIIGHYLAFSGKIRKKNAEIVVGNSKCFLIRCEGTNINGTIRERAQTCVDLEFTFSATIGNCEVFVNCVTQGIYTTNKGTVQGGGAVATAVDSIKTEHQCEEMLNKLALNLNDNDSVARFRAEKQRRIEEGL